jgi:hypothetical protein
VKSTVYAGGWALGVRAGSLEIDALVRTLLGDRCRDDLNPPGNYSISVETESDDSPATLPTLYGGHTALLRSRSMPLLVGGLLASLAAHEQAERDGLLMWLDATALVTSDGRAILAAPGHRRYVVDRLRALRRVGLRYHPVRDVAIDTSTGELVLVALDGVDDAAAAVLNADPQVTETLARPGRYPIAGWAVQDILESGTPLSGAKAVLRTFSMATNRDVLGAQRVLDTLARVFSTARALSVHRTPDAVVTQLEALAAPTAPGSP